MRPVINDKYKINSKILNVSREIYIYHPPDQEQTYPVIYLLDGHSLHNITASLVQRYSERDRIPPAIVVGIASTDTLRDLTPTEREAYNGKHGGGGAKNFHKFLTQKLIPIVEEEYQTSHRTLIGHSYGGLYVTHTLATNPETFDAYLAYSPWFNQSDNTIINQISQQLQQGYSEHKQFYLAHEPIESPGIENSIVKLKKVLEKHTSKDFNWTYKRYSDADHSNLPLKTIPDALDFFYPGHS